MAHWIINTEYLNIKIYKESWQYRLAIQNWTYEEDYFSDICFDSLSDLIKQLEKEITFYKEINTYDWIQHSR